MADGLIHLLYENHRSPGVKKPLVFSEWMS
jgi:hypothetical protein